MIVIVDSGGANLMSLFCALRRHSVEVCVSDSASVIRKASHVILPGVGSAPKIMKRLKALRLVDVIQSLTQPVLGICIGLQILFDFSEEGATSCLGIVEGTIKKLPQQSLAILPHMGWNSLQHANKTAILADVPANSFVFFVHSYAASISTYTTAVTHYGLPFSASIQQENFFGVQFHPERSGQIGEQILKNFLEL